MKIGWAFIFLLAALLAPTWQSTANPPAKPFEPRALSWEGKATIHAGERKIDIRVRTRISKEGHVLSESWPVEQGEAGIRRMIIDDSGGWMERGGKREPMPPEMLEHERQQFGFYAQMQKVLAYERQTSLGPHIVVEGRVKTKFHLMGDRVINATNQVSSPEPGGKPIPQAFYFPGRQSAHGLKWPRRIQIYQHGKLYFDLKIEKFEVGTAP